MPQLDNCASAFVNDVDIFVTDSQLLDDQIFNADQSSFKKKFIREEL